MVRQLDETAAERDLTIKLGFGSWVFYIWAVLMVQAACGLALVVATTLARAAAVGLFRGPRILYDLNNLITTSFTLLVAVICIGSFPVALTFRLRYRDRLAQRAGVSKGEE